MTPPPAKLPLEMLYHWVDTRPDDIYLHQPKAGHWQTHSWSQVLEQVARLAGGLRGLGLKPGDRVGLLSKNCAEWFICDLALQMGGYVSVPIYPTAGEDTVRYVLEHSECRALFIGKLDTPEQLLGGIPEGVIRIALPYQPEVAADHRWEELLASEEALAERPVPEADALMSLVYTSGSTGQPKGVMISYAAYRAACRGVVQTAELGGHDTAFSYLPLAHITERVYILGGSLYAGMTVGFAQSLDTFIEDVKTMSPTVFISVPRLWANFRSGILEKLPQGRLDLLLRIPFVSALVKKKVRAGLGLTRARILGCGSAPIAPSILRWYERLDMPITEAWGMTENLAYSTLNYPYRSDKVGTVGKPGVGVDIRLSENGEVLCRCDGLMSGYYKDEDATAEILRGGWLHTGDQGKLDDDGYLTITGRVKDAFKTAKGKYVLPVPIEAMLVENELIEQVCVIGSGLAQPIALVQLAPGANGNHKGALAERLDGILTDINRHLEKHQRLNGILIMKAPWTVENKLMTPTLKIKRHLLEQRYADIEQHWVAGQHILWEQDLH